MHKLLLLDPRLCLKCLLSKFDKPLRNLTLYISVPNIILGLTPLIHGPIIRLIVNRSPGIISSHRIVIEMEN